MTPFAPPCSLLLFDLDGCLIDSTTAITGSLSVALADAGLGEHVPASLAWVVGPPLRLSLERILRDAGRDPADAPTLMDAYRAHYAVHAPSTTTLFDGMGPLLRAAGERHDVRCAVVTSKPGGQARPLIEHVGIAEHLVEVHAPGDDHGAEPKTATLQRALDSLAADLPSEQVVMIGDRHHDIDAGRAHGTRTVGVTWGAGARRELEDAGADRVVDTPAQLGGVLGVEVA